MDTSKNEGVFQDDYMSAEESSAIIRLFYEELHTRKRQSDEERREQERRMSLPTVKAVAEALGGVPEAEVQRLLRQVRTAQAVSNPKDDAVMIWIPPGQFWMGDDEIKITPNPRRKVFLDGYWIYKHPVTVAQFKKFCQEAPTPTIGMDERRPGAG